MSSFERGAHSFIVRIWCEPREIDGAAPEWRGMIEHVPSGDRRYLQDLDSILAFIVLYLEEMGVTFGMRWRARQCLKRWNLI